MERLGNAGAGIDEVETAGVSNTLTLEPLLADLVLVDANTVTVSDESTLGSILDTVGRDLGLLLVHMLASHSAVHAEKLTVGRNGSEHQLPLAPREGGDLHDQLFAVGDNDDWSLFGASLRELLDGLARQRRR